MGREEAPLNVVVGLDTCWDAPDLFGKYLYAQDGLPRTERERLASILEEIRCGLEEADDGTV